MDKIVVTSSFARIEIGNEKDLLEAVRHLRHQVFCLEEGFGQDMVEFCLDDSAAHILIQAGQKIAACATVVPPDAAAEYGRYVSLPVKFIGRAALATKLAVIPEYRGKHVPSLIVALMEDFIFRPAEIRYAFIVLKGKHCQSERFYRRISGSFRAAEGVCAYGRRLVLVIDRESQAFQGIKENILAPLGITFRRENRGGQTEG